MTWLIDGRPITNTEMDQRRQAVRREREQRRAELGCCCEEGPWDNGKCRHALGKCPLLEAAENLIWRAARDGDQ